MDTRKEDKDRIFQEVYNYIFLNRSRLAMYRAEGVHERRAGCCCDVGEIAVVLVSDGKRERDRGNKKES